ncbi:MAG: cupin domain-containing protein [Solirubrobacterales bacterium]
MSVHPILGELDPDPLDPAQVVAGEPATADLTLAESPGGETAGLWSCTPGSFTDTEVEESFVVISGRATIGYEDGTVVALRPGTVHRFAGGERTVWTVEEKLLKAYWIAG